MSESSAKAIWRNIAMSGLVLTLIGMAAISLFISSPSLESASFLASHIEATILATFVGVAILSIGMIGWAVLLGKVGRENLAFFAGCFPFCVIVLGVILGRRDPHGTAVYFWFPMSPLFAVALILAMMSTFARRP